MTQVSSKPHEDQASRLRALVDSLDDNGEQIAESRPRLRSAPVIAIASGKGGVGKTTTSVNLSIALTRLGKRIVLLDADLGMANADVLCGMMPKIRLEKTVGRENVRSLHEIALDAPGGFRLVPGSVGLGRMGELDEIEQKELISRLIELERSSDFVLIDTSAGMGKSVTRFVEAADLGIIVATPEPTSIADAYALIKVLVGLPGDPVNNGESKKPKPPRLAVVLNQVINQKEADLVHGRIAGVCQRFLGYDLPLLGYIRRDKRVINAVKRRTPLMIASPRCGASKDMMKVAQKLVEWAQA